MDRIAPDIIQKLVETFGQNLDSYRSGKNETELRREFLDKFFAALGWDVANDKGYDEAGKEVVHEFSVDVVGQQKKADYAFRVGRGEKFDFLVEAKKPSVRVESSQEAAFQLRRYGWSAKLPVNILTDFEHFAVYDCRAKPSITDKASFGRILLVHYSEYVERWDEIAAIFSPEAVRKGSFAKYAEGTKGKKGTADVDDAFLQEIERWRELLAKNIALRKKDLDIAGLNYAVQMTIDRIVFLRICEERGIEPENQLLDISAPTRPSATLPHSEVQEWGRTGEGIYSQLCALFQRADTKYNSGLFHFKKEKGQASQADDLTLSLSIDDKILRDIISNLYYPKSPYAFLYIPSDILGQVYERFLGKVIRLTDGHQAKVEEKPEVRKAGGVYYTPTYIVDYIVKNTVGKLVDPTPGPSPDGKTPSGEGRMTPKEVANLKIVDPACGSGTFLLGAYQYLLDWHLNWYTEHDPEKWVKAGVLAPSGAGAPPPPNADWGSSAFEGGRVGAGYRLTTAKKKEILLNNLHGVDIDAQAVEVTKLSLLLKVLENASGQLGLGLERVLPDLGENIKCGNSLIGSDYFEGQMFADEAERARVNPFDWRSEFPQVFARGGFDAVIGNPPYIRIQAMQEWAPESVEFYKQRYIVAGKGNYDIYVVFVEKGLSLLNANGRLGFILPHKFFNAQYGEPLRGVIANGKHLSKVIHFGDQQVFDGATTYTCLMFLDKAGKDEFEIVKVKDLAGWREAQTSEVCQTSEVLDAGTLAAASVTAAEWNFTVGAGAGLFEKLSQMPVKLGAITDLFVGLQTDADDVYILEEVKQEGRNVLCRSKYTGKEHWFENDHLKPFLKGSLNIRRYYFSDVNKRLIFPYVTIDGKSFLIDQKEYKQQYPLTWAYLEECKTRLAARNKGNMGKDWHGYVYRKNHTRFDSTKLLVPSLAMGSCFSADLEGKFYFVGSGGGGGGGYGISLLPTTKIGYSYLLGVLNSNLISQYLKKVSTPFQHGYFALNRQYIEQLPIRAIDFTNPVEKAQHDKLVSLVEQMLAAHRSLSAAQTPGEKERLERQIAVTDRAIDSLVYELYGLSEEEIGIVEG